MEKQHLLKAVRSLKIILLLKGETQKHDLSTGFPFIFQGCKGDNYYTDYTGLHLEQPSFIQDLRVFSLPKCIDIDFSLPGSKFSDTAYVSR